MEIYSAGAYIPHPEKAYRGGEDAFFYTTPSLSAIGVADGVGGWARQKINPKLFADDLMEHTMKAIEDGEKDPVNALDHAYSKVEQESALITLFVVYCLRVTWANDHTFNDHYDCYYI